VCPARGHETVTSSTCYLGWSHRSMSVAAFLQRLAIGCLSSSSGRRFDTLFRADPHIVPWIEVREPPSSTDMTGLRDRVVHRAIDVRLTSRFGGAYGEQRPQRIALCRSDRRACRATDNLYLHANFQCRSRRESYGLCHATRMTTSAADTIRILAPTPIVVPVAADEGQSGALLDLSECLCTAHARSRDLPSRGGPAPSTQSLTSNDTRARSLALQGRRWPG